MLLFRGLAGLGVNPAMQSTFNKDLVQNGGQSGGEGVWSDKAGTINLTQHLWYDIGTEAGWGDVDASGVKATPESDARMVSIFNARALAQVAAAANAPACPTEAITEVSNGMPICYYGRHFGAAYANAINRTFASAPESLVPPFTFAAYGVPFALNELKNGKFQRTFVPNVEQRTAIELSIIEKSTLRFFGHFTPLRNARQLVGDEHGLIYQAALKMKYDPQWKARLADPSVDDMLELVPDMALYLINFERNPVQPSPSERTDRGGWKTWIMRGGYPLSKALAHAQAPMYKGYALTMCSSIACRCGEPSTFTASGYEYIHGGTAACYPITVNGKGIVENNNDAYGEWADYIAISQDPNNPWFQVTVRYENPSAWDEMTHDLARYAEKVSQGICMALVANKDQITAIVKETCTDKNAKPCTKGSTGCTCKAPSETSKLSVGAFNTWTQYACGKILTEWDQPDPLQNLPPPVDAPVIPPPAKKIPWWLVGVVGVVAGATAFIGGHR